MPYASINVFTLHPGQMETFLSVQREAFLPLLRRHAGFLALEIVQTGADSGVATLWWASEEARRAATPSLNEWVETHLVPFFASLDNPAGPVVFTSRDGTTSQA